jgi:superoxide dismutase, Cu-Zn family
MRRKVAFSFLSPCVITLLVAGCGTSDDTPAATAAGAGGATSTANGSPGASDDDLTARLVDPQGKQVGTVKISDADDGLEIAVEVEGLPPGFHGFHVHAIGKCEPNSANPTDPSMVGNFLSAGGHIGAGATDHGKHAGDLPVLYVDQSGKGSLKTVTDALTRGDLTDADGSAVMVHADADNYANIPTRYAPGGPDQMTRNTGDAGGRIACGRVEG